MPDISVQFDVVDRFSSAMEKFTHMVEACSGGADKLAESAQDAGEKLKEVSDASVKGSMQFKGFGASMMVMNQAMQAFTRIAEPVKQALDDIAQKQRVIVMFGKEAGDAFNIFANRAARELGRVEGEVRKAGLKWQKVGIGGENIMELTKLADRFANLNPDKSFEEVADTFRDAVRNKDVSGLAELLGGGEAIELKLQRSGVERRLRRGDIAGALEQFKKVADAFDMTQAKADQMGNTIDKKLAKIANLGRNYITDMFSDIVAKAEPYIDKILSWLQSKEVQSALEQIKSFVSKIADAFFSVGYYAFKAVSSIARFIYANKGIVLAVGSILAFNKALMAIKAAGGVLAIATKGFGILKTAILGVIPVVKSLFAAIMTPFGAISIAVLGITKIFQTIFNKVTGSSVSFVEALVGIFVGGTVQIAAGIEELAQNMWNGLVTMAELAVNGIVAIINKAGEQLYNSRLVKAVRGLRKKVDSTYVEEQYKGIGYVDFSDAMVKPIDSTQVAADAVSKVMGKINGIKDSLGFGGKKDALDDIDSKLDPLKAMSDDVSKIRAGMQKEQDLRWMKEMAEQRFVNEVNLRQLTPTINLQVKGANASPQAYAKALARELQQMADAGTYNAYGDAV